ncbi:ThiF family adenylyltransferase [Candidatus Poriferisodalis sp.]|uniref:ThiF family adenylyltransferase n=1 Tax=Candidatus Poriferisodalis sp. TaxID=3101277 RepID=UPI003B01F790
MSRSFSVAMTAGTHQALGVVLVRDDRQEDVCLALYRPSTGEARTTALLTSVVPPVDSDRAIHGNATVFGEYMLRGAERARDDGCGLMFAHSHPGASDWQPMSRPDREAEASYANLIREITGLPLVGMTLATRDEAWSARRWDIGAGTGVDCTHAENVRVIGEQLRVSWNEQMRPSPFASTRQERTVSAWGDKCQSDLVRRRILVVGAGSVGMDVIVRLAASGIQRLTVMDFDVVEEKNLDRLIGAAQRDVRLRRPKIHVANRLALASSTAERRQFEFSSRSICEPEGLSLALDHDLIFSCVDRPWPRAVLNGLAYSDLIPVIDGGIAIDTNSRGRMLNATWRSHVVRPGRPCLACNRQLDLGLVTPDRQGDLDDPSYIEGAGIAPEDGGQNVSALSASVSASLLAQYVSFSVAPGGIGDPGPIQYSLSSHFLDYRDDAIRPHCPVEPSEAVGDLRPDLSGEHPIAEEMRQMAAAVDRRTRVLRWADNRLQALTNWIDRR